MSFTTIQNSIAKAAAKLSREIEALSVDLARVSQGQLITAMKGGSSERTVKWARGEGQLRGSRLGRPREAVDARDTDDGQRGE